MGSIRVLKDKGIYETASKVLQHIGAIFDYAIIIMGLLENSPTVGVSKYIKKPADKRDRHYPALEGKEMLQFLEDYEKTTLKPRPCCAVRPTSQQAIEALEEARLYSRNSDLVFQSDAIERQLAHVEGNKVKAAYDRNKHLKERTRLMQPWANVYSGFRPRFCRVDPVQPKLRPMALDVNMRAIIIPSDARASELVRFVTPSPSIRSCNR